MDNIFDIVILGSGPAGLTAALYAGRAGRSVAIVAGGELGGQMATIPELENYPGVIGPISGFEVTEIMKNQAESFGAKIILASAKFVKRDNDNYNISLDNGKELVARAIIVATGARAKTMGIPGESEYLGRGVSYCAVCDGFFYRGKDVVFIGGGNSALVEALYMSKLAKHVTIIYRRDAFFRGEKVVVDKIMNATNISVMWNTDVVEIMGDANGVTSVLTQEIDSEKQNTINIDGVFITIGHSPNTEFLNDEIKRDDHGHLVTLPNKTQIENHGIFVAGDVRANTKLQVAIAVGWGATAAMEVEDYLIAS